MKRLFSQDTAFVSVDNTRTFEDITLHELYVSEGEQVAKHTKEVIQFLKSQGVLLINILEEHPLGHLSLAENYIGKNPYDVLTLEEVMNWTPESHGISERAEFTLDQLKAFLQEKKQQILRPDHSIAGTSGVEMMPPLQRSDFDLTIIKGEDPANDGYSGFDETPLHQELQQRNIKNVIITGVATDYCSGKTAVDGKALGYDVYFLQEGSRGVAPESTEAMIKEFYLQDVNYLTLKELLQLF